MPNTCIFVLPTTGKKCQRESIGHTNVCPLHGTGTPKELADYLATLVAKKDGNWVGLRSEGAITFNKTCNFLVDLRHAELHGATFDGAQFLSGLDIQKSNFEGHTRFIKTKISGTANFDHCTFSTEPADFESCVFNLDENDKGITQFTNCQFRGPVTFSGEIRTECRFSQTSFFDSIVFRGGWIHYASVGPEKISLSENVIAVVRGEESKQIANAPIEPMIRRLQSARQFAGNIFMSRIDLVKSRLDKLINSRTRQQKSARKPLFYREVYMENVNFHMPQLTRFTSVNLSRAKVEGTDFRGVQLLDVTWTQPALKRRGLFDEILTLQMPTRDQKRFWPKVEAAYRNLRITLEQNKAYDSASDFYIGEMYSRLRQRNFWTRPLTVEFWYGAVSNYGTSPSRAFLVLLIICLLHISGTLLVPSIRSQLAIYETLTSQIVELVGNTANVLTYKDASLGANLSGPVGLMNTVFRIIGAIQIAMFALSLRSRIKRH